MSPITEQKILHMLKNLGRNEIAMSFQDDTAVIPLNDEKVMVISTDTCVEMRHFLPYDAPFFVGQKIIRESISDVLASGVEPEGIFLNITYSDCYNEEQWSVLIQGIATALNQYRCELWGGDTTKGKESVFSVTVLGRANRRDLMLRHKAQPEDYVCYLGVLGDAAVGLALKKNCMIYDLSRKEKQYFMDRYECPDLPCIASMKCVRQYSCCAMDVSDGLLLDFSRLTKASQVDGVIHLEKIPLSKPLDKLVKQGQVDVCDIATWGDNYGILFTLAPKFYKKLIVSLKKVESFQKMSILGEIGRGTGEVQIKRNGKFESLPMHLGFNHS